jgi:hypothetical protein
VWALYIVNIFAFGDHKVTIALGRSSDGLHGVLRQSNGRYYLSKRHSFLSSISFSNISQICFCLFDALQLLEILSDESHSELISWCVHGNGFLIHKKKLFASEVLPKYFKASKFTSFTRKLNRWGFNRVPRGPETGAYYHKLFRRDKPELCLQMTSNSGNKYQSAPQQHLLPNVPGMMPGMFPYMGPPAMMGNLSPQQQQAMWHQQMMHMQHMQMQMMQMQQMQQQGQQQQRPMSAPNAADSGGSKGDDQSVTDTGVDDAHGSPGTLQLEV